MHGGKSCEINAKPGKKKMAKRKAKPKRRGGTKYAR